MSKVVEIYDSILETLAGILNTHARLPNPYKPDENAEAFLVSGYGLRIGPASNMERTLGCQLLHEERNFTIVLSRKYFAREDDADNKAEAERELFNDAFAVKKYFESNPTMDGLATTSKFSSDSGTSYVFATKDRFLTTEITVSIEYIEHLNS